jgi:sigma-B regulation protein RsbU (phosphoserine phosphatase)
LEKSLERQLYIQKLQMKRLFELAQAISNNAATEHLINLYHSTLCNETEVDCFALFVYQNNNWNFISSAKLNSDFNPNDLVAYFANYNKTTKLTGAEVENLAYFDFVLPIFQNNQPLAVVLLKNIGSPNEYLHDNLDFIKAITEMLALSIENKKLFQQQLEQERLQRELELAIQMQNMLIPAQLPNNQQYEFSGIYQPYSGVGGDYYDVIKLDDEEIAFCIADISGKGVAAALLMSNFQANVHALIHRKNVNFRKFIQSLNSSVLATTKGEKFITFFLARYDLERKRLRYICAGHNPPYLITQNKLQKLDKGCTILGAFDEINQIELGEIYLEEDAFLLLYTDGLTDLQNEQQVYFSERLENFVLNNCQKPAFDFNNLLLQEINNFRGKTAFSDDVSVLTARIFT